MYTNTHNQMDQLQKNLKQARALFQQALQLPRPNYYNHYKRFGSSTFKYNIAAKQANSIIAYVNSCNLSAFHSFCHQAHLSPHVYIKYNVISYSPYSHSLSIFLNIAYSTITL